jgi:two-component system, OmpR family, response regulator
MSRILVVEDEPMIARFVGRALRSRGWVVEWAHDGKSALQLVFSTDYSLVLLDLMIPAISGEDVLRKIMAARPDQRVMVVSGRADSQTKVRCLEAGAADYLCKPFSVDELLARVQVRLREQATPTGDAYLRREGLTLDLTHRKAFVANNEVHLTEREFMLLAHLLSDGDKVFSREELLSEVWGYSFDPGSNVVDVYIRRLRSKLGGHLIETVRNVGYRVTAC